MGAGNALQHLAWLFPFRTYAPGVVTATFLVLPAAVLFMLRIPRRIPVLVECGVIIAVVVLGAVSTYQAGPVLQGHEIAFQQQLIHLARDLGV